MSINSRLRILTYHRVAGADEVYPYDPRLISATPSLFARQMAWLAKHHNVIDIGDLLQALDGTKPLPKHAVLITFDDAYQDFRQHAWPILRRHGLAVTMFVPTGFPDQPQRSFWWDRLYAAVMTSPQLQLEEPTLGVLPLHTPEERRQSSRVLNNHVKSMPHQQAMSWVDDCCRQLTGSDDTAPAAIMSWQELRQLADEGVTIAAHSRNHPLMTQVTSDQAYEEITGSLADLKQRFGQALPIFCYPAGAFNQSVRDVAESAGIRLAFTTRLGHNLLNKCDLLTLNRINITPRTTPAMLQMRLSVTGARLDMLRWRLKQRLRGRRY